MASVCASACGTAAARRCTPDRLRGLARLAERMLTKLGYHGPVDVLGVSWGGAAAQQLARSYPARCRRAVLAAATPGVLMVPGSPFVLSKISIRAGTATAPTSSGLRPTILLDKLNLHAMVASRHRSRP